MSFRSPAQDKVAEAVNGFATQVVASADGEDQGEAAAAPRGSEFNIGGGVIRFVVGRVGPREVLRGREPDVAGSQFNDSVGRCHPAPQRGTYKITLY